jgi:hypothetical protein
LPARRCTIAVFAKPANRRLAVVVGVDEVLAGVVGRVDVDHLDLAQVGLLQQLENLQVVAFDDEVPGGVEVDALLAARSQSTQARGLDGAEAIALAGPVHAVAFAANLDGLTERELEPLEVDAPVLGAHLGEDAQELLALLLSEVVRAQVDALRLLDRRRCFALLTRSAHGLGSDGVQGSEVITLALADDLFGSRATSFRTPGVAADHGSRAPARSGQRPELHEAWALPADVVTYVLSAGRPP